MNRYVRFEEGRGGSGLEQVIKGVRYQECGAYLL